MASSASSNSSPLAGRTNGRQMLVQSLPQIINTFPQLSSVKSCVMLGCGHGNTDLEFVSRCLPNVEKLTAVEPDADEVAALKTRVAQLLPHVSTEFCQETAQSWAGTDQPFDAVLLFHCLYFIPQLERPALFKKLFDNVVAKGGFVFIITSSCDLENLDTFSKLIDLLGVWSYTMMDAVDVIQVRDTMTSVGFRHCYELSTEFQSDAEEPNDDLMTLLVFWSGGKLSLEQVRETVTEALAGEKCLQDMWFGAFQKP